MTRHKSISLIVVTNLVLVASSPALGQRPRMTQEAAALLAPLVSPSLRSAVHAKQWNKRGSVRFDERPFEDAIDSIAERFGVNIRIDKLALEESSVASDSPISYVAENETLGGVFKHMLEPLDLATIVGEECVTITTLEKARDLTETFYYPVHDLIEGRDGYAGTNAMRGARSADLAVMLTECVAPDHWEEAGGPGRIGWIPNLGMLVVSANRRAHEDLYRVLCQLRSSMPGYITIDWRQAFDDGVAVQSRDDLPQEKPRSSIRSSGLIRQPLARTPVPAAIPLFSADPRNPNAAREEQLDQRVSVHIREQPLNEVIENLSRRTGVPIHLDIRAMEEASVTADTPVSLRMKDVRLRFALENLLEPLDLATYIDHEDRWTITTTEKLKTQLTMTVYPMADLVADGNSAVRSGSMKMHALDVMAILETHVDPESWEVSGGPARIQFFAPSRSLVVSQTYESHREVAATIAILRAAMRNRRLWSLFVAGESLAPRSFPSKNDQPANPRASIEVDSRPKNEKPAKPKTDDDDPFD